MRFKKNADFYNRNTRLLNYIYNIIDNNDVGYLQDKEHFDKWYVYKKEWVLKRPINIIIDNVLIHVNKNDTLVLYNKEQFEIHINGVYRISFLLMDINNISFDIRKY